MCKRTRRVGLVGAAFVITACAAGTVALSDSDLTGVYALSSINGVQLPSPTSNDECAAVVSDGQLVISPQQGETLPLYILQAYGHSPCHDANVPSASRVVLSDRGDWHTRDRSIVMESRSGHATSIASVTGAGSGRSVTLAIDGQESVWQLARGVADPVAPVAVRAVTPDGVRVNGLYFRIRDARGLVARGITNADRALITGVSPGEAEIYLTAPPGYRLQSAQPNPVRIHVPAVQGAQFTVVLDTQSR